MNIICYSCHREQEAQVSKELPHRVICRYCSKKIDNVTDFTVKTLVAQKRFANEEKAGFAFHCEQCKGVQKGLPQRGTPEDKKKVWIKCSNCGAKMKNVSDFMIRQMSGLIKDETK
jgi:hypothetical protein